MDKSNVSVIRSRGVGSKDTDETNWLGKTEAESRSKLKPGEKGDSWKLGSTSLTLKLIARDGTKFPEPLPAGASIDKEMLPLEPRSDETSYIARVAREEI